jgi:prepilin signal peptidase PulO-like enzyme (type II secretory pathway)
VAIRGETSRRVFVALVIGFGAQIAGRLVDLRWHLTHDEFEGGIEQLQAHWLIWLATLFVLGTAVRGVRHAASGGERRGHQIVLVANLSYAVVAVIHFFQHLNRLEVDWAHVLLAVTGIAGAVGVLWVVAVRLKARRHREAVG